jgi:cardiolipin synthase (CMP-forming)
MAPEKTTGRRVGDKSFKSMQRKRRLTPTGNRPSHTHRVANRWRVADALSGLRLLLIPALWLAALFGNGRLVGVGLLVAGATDFFDGYLARRLAQESAAGARLDAIADNLLLLSAMVWIGLLHPEIARENTVLITITFGLYLASMAVGLVKFRQLGNLHLYSSKVAGGFLYTFAVLTLVTGGYEPVLLTLAAVVFMVSSAETLVAQLFLAAVNERMGSVLLVRKTRAETSTIQVIGSARKQRSHAPHAEKAVDSSARPMSSSPAAAAPSPNDKGP